MLPVLVLEKVLRNIEATSLARLRSVSSSWNSTIIKHLQRSDAWYCQCKNDIPERYWLLLLENTVHLSLLYQQGVITDGAQKYNYEIWLAMYKAWKKWQNIQNLIVNVFYEVKCIPRHRVSEYITCCAVLGELLAVGSTEGYISVLNLRTNQLVFRVDQYEEVLDLKFCTRRTNSKKIILISTNVFYKSRVWDITDHKNVKFISDGRATCAGYGYYCTALVHDKIFVYDAATDDCFPIRLLTESFINSQSNYKGRINLNGNTRRVNMIMNKCQLCFWSNVGVYCELNLREINNKSNKFSCTPDIKYIGVPSNENVYNYYLFNPHVLFCVTDRGHLGISVDKSEWQMYNVFPIFESIVTAIHFAVRVFIIGLDCGDVYLFSVKNEMALKEMDFKTSKSKRIHIGCEPIISVNLMEILGDQRLLVATKRTIYHIKLDSSVS